MSESRSPLAHISIAAPVYQLRLAAASYVAPGHNNSMMSTLGPLKSYRDRALLVESFDSWPQDKLHQFPLLSIRYQV